MPSQNFCLTKLIIFLFLVRLDLLVTILWPLSSSIELSDRQMSISCLFNVAIRWFFWATRLLEMTLDATNYILMLGCTSHWLSLSCSCSKAILLVWQRGVCQHALHITLADGVSQSCFYSWVWPLDPSSTVVILDYYILSWWQRITAPWNTERGASLKFSVVWGQRLADLHNSHEGVLQHKQGNSRHMYYNWCHSRSPFQ